MAWFIFALALVLRLVFAWVYVSGHPARALATIPFLFEPGNIAYSIASGHGFSSPFRVETGPTAWMTPVYPLLLAGVFRIFGTYTLNAFVAAATLNILFSALTALPVFYVGERIGGRKVAVAAALLWSVFPNAIFLPYESLWDSSLAALLMATILWASFALLDSPNRTRFLLYGLLWGAALMTNAALVSLLPFLFGWVAWRTHREQPSGHYIAAAAIVLCCAPWTIRNFRVFHTFVPLRSVSGLALWIGNNGQAEGTAVGRMHPISNQAEREKYAEMGEIAYMREKQNEAVRYMLSHPAVEARLTGLRFEAIWTGGSANLIQDFRTSRSLRFYFVVLFNLGAALGTVAGAVILWRERSQWAFPLTVCPIVFPLVYYLALAPPRYRHPIDPVLVTLTAVALTHLPNYRKRPVSPTSRRST